MSSTPESQKRRASSTTSGKQTTLVQALLNVKRPRVESGMVVDQMKSPMSLHTNARMNSKTTVRKIVIKNFTPRDFSTREADYYESTFKKLEQALDQILSGKKIAGLQDLYKGCENAVRGGQAERCSHLAYDKMAVRIKNLKLTLASQINAGESAVHSVLEIWKSWLHQLSLIRSIFFYLDRTYFLNMPNAVSIYETGTSLFRMELILQSEIKLPLVQGLISLLNEQRDSKHDQLHASIKDVMQLFATVKLYDSLFEPHFLKATEQYYHAESEKSYAMPITELLELIVQRLVREAQQAEHYLKPSTKLVVLDIVRQQLIKANAEHIVDAFERIIDGRDTVKLQDMYSLLLSVNETPRMRAAFAKYVRSAGLSILSDKANDKTMVESLLKFKKEMDDILANAFQSEDLFSKALRDQFASFINSRGDVPAEMMAKYIDAVLRSGNKKFDEHDLETQMSQLMDIFRFIASKDVFEAFYKKDLAKRLLLNKSASSDAETSLLKKLRVECGPQFTSKLEGMFKDIDISRDYNRSNTNLEVMVLSQGSWPTYPEVKAQLPEYMSEALAAFQALYLKSNQGRKLMWRHTLGQCQLKASFPKGDKELAVSLFQAIVLLLFENSSITLSYLDIKVRVGLDDKELIRTLQSLACGKAENRVLLKSPKGKDVIPTDIFKINDSFQNLKKIVRINQIQMKETAEENKATHERVIQDRSFEIQAAIIRIMKSAKRKTHAELVASTIDTIKGRGIPQVADIKKAIEKLLDREYLSRHDKEYHYEA